MKYQDFNPQNNQISEEMINFLRYFLISSHKLSLSEKIMDENILGCLESACEHMDFLNKRKKISK